MSNNEYCCKSHCRTGEQTGTMPFKLDVRVRPIAPKGNLLGLAANVTIGACFVRSTACRICAGEKGAVCQTCPPTQDGQRELEGRLQAGHGGFPPASSMRR